ncbi:MAG TPA: hypothetical protein VF826_08915 [Chloroflexia bacterium]
MPFCEDKFLSFLNDYGYNVVRLPRENITPMKVIGRHKDELGILGSLSDLVSEGPEVPSVTKDQHAGQISGEQSSVYDFKVGVTVLKRLLSFIGAGGIELEAAYKGAQKLRFSFDDVFVDSIDPIPLGRYLGASVPDISNPLIDQLDDKGEAYIIFETLKSKSFAVTAHDENGASVAVDVSAIKKALDVEAKVAVASASERKVSYSGDRLLTFGFKAFPVWIEFYDGHGFFSMAPASRGIGGLSIPTQLANPAEPTPVLLARNTLLKLSE